MLAFNYVVFLEEVVGKELFSKGYLNLVFGFLGVDSILFIVSFNYCYRLLFDIGCMIIFYFYVEFGF